MAYKTILKTLLICSFFCPAETVAQESQLSRFAIHLELLGTGMLLSATVEHSLMVKESNALCVNLGAAGWFFRGKPFHDPYLTGYTGGINYLRGSGNCYFETGLGITYLLSGEAYSGATALFLIPRAGIRYYASNKRLIWRFGLTPPFHLKSIVTHDFTPAYLPMFGGSVGWVLGK